MFMVFLHFYKTYTKPKFTESETNMHWPYFAGIDDVITTGSRSTL